MDKKKEDLKHMKIKYALRIIGIILLIAGIVLIAISIKSMKDFDTDKFNLSFAGIPLAFIGIACLIYGFMGNVARYSAKEYTPVIKDTTNEILDGTGDSIGRVAGKISQNIHNAKMQKVCPYCGNQETSDAVFCSKCGKDMQNVKCPYCGADLSPTSKFCNNCGKKIG